jgi:ECF transporter S component (folate family)
MALLIAIEIVLSRFLSFSAWNMKIGLSFLPVAVAGILLGPIPAGIVAALGDFIGAVLFPIGAYFPGFTLTAFLTGCCFGAFLFHKQTPRRILAAVAVNQLAFSLALNSLWISMLYGSPYLPLLTARLIQCAVLFPVQFVSVLLLVKSGLIQTLRQKIE